VGKKKLGKMNWGVWAEIYGRTADRRTSRKKKTGGHQRSEWNHRRGTKKDWIGGELHL